MTVGIVFVWGNLNLSWIERLDFGFAITDSCATDCGAVGFVCEGGEVSLVEVAIAFACGDSEDSATVTPPPPQALKNMSVDTRLESSRVDLH
jgi:hypothetical protein